MDSGKTETAHVDGHCRPMMGAQSSDFVQNRSSFPAASSEEVSEFLCVRHVQSHPPLGVRL